MKKLLYVSLFSIITAAHNLLFAHNTLPSYHAISVNRDIWKAVHIVYNQDFPYKQNYNKQKIKECKKIYISPALNNQTETKKTVPVLRCVEHIKLLRPDKIARQWLKTQNKKHFFPLTLSTFNFVNIHARITAIHPIKSENQRHFLHNGQTKIVTGQFERHTINIKRYTFRNIETGKITTVNATPEHPVYVKNRATFVPMDLLLNTDHLLNNAGQEIRLICRGNHTQHCSESLHNNIPLPVYNLEIDHSHTYFISDIRLLVHNVCKLAKKLHEKIPELIEPQRMRHKSEDFLSIKSNSDVHRAFAALREIEGNNVESDSYVILAACLHHRQKIRIRMLELFLAQRKNLDFKRYDNLFSNLIRSRTMQAHSFTPLEMKTDNIFNILLAKAGRKPVVIMANKNLSLIYPDSDGCPVLEILHKSEFKIEHHHLGMSTQVSGLASKYGYDQPIKYWTLMVSPNFTG